MCKRSCLKLSLHECIVTRVGPSFTGIFRPQPVLIVSTVYSEVTKVTRLSYLLPWLISFETSLLEVEVVTFPWVIPFTSLPGFLFGPLHGPAAYPKTVILDIDENLCSALLIAVPSMRGGWLDEGWSASDGLSFIVWTLARNGTIQNSMTQFCKNISWLSYWFSLVSRLT